MFPAHERLERDDLVAFRADDRLIVHLQLAPGERVTQVLLDLAPLLRAVLEVVRIEAVLAPPAPFRRIKRKVGALDQVRRLDAVVRRDRHAYRSADDRATPVERIGLRNHLDDPLRELTQFPAIVDVGKDHLEFVAAETADLASPADDLFEPLGHLLQQLVSGGMAERIVDLLEAVEVEHHQRAASLGRLVGGQRRRQPLGHAVPVREPGE
jgi:hypothetical protein